MTQIPGRDEERRLTSFLDMLDGEAEAARKDLTKTWEENIRQARGDQWRIRRNPYFLANVIRNQIRRKVAALTESNPEFQIRAFKPRLAKASNVLYQVIKSIFQREATSDAIVRLAQFGMTVGCGFIRVTYNKLTNDVELSFIDPRRVWIDPAITAASELSKAQYLRIDSVLPIYDIRRIFPGRGALVKPNERYSSYTSGSRFSSGSSTILGSVLSLFPQPYRPGFPSKQGPIPRAEIREYWLRDPQINMEGDPLFPGGRHIVRSGEVILLDENNPYWDGEWDLEMFEWDMDYDSPWGKDDVQDLRRIQEAINRIGDSWVHNLILGGNFKVVADMDALDPDQWGKLDNEAGLTIRKKPNRQLEFVPGIPPSLETPAAIEGLIKLCDLLTGNIDPARGRTMTQSSSVFEGLQQSSLSLVRASARRLESTLQRVGQKLIARIFQYFQGDRILFQLGPTREWVSYVYSRQELLENDEGDPRSASEIQEMYRDFKFLIRPGSSLAVSRLQRVMALLQLRGATGIVPSVKTILAEADLGDPDAMLDEALEEAKKLPPPPPAKGRGGKS